MLGTHKIIVDEWAEVWDLLKPYADGSFWRWSDLDPCPDCIYIVGRVVLKQNWTEIRNWAHQNPGKVIFSNPAEGSQTILLQLTRLRIRTEVEQGIIGLLTSGELEPGIDYCKTDCYFSNICEYIENLQAAEFQCQVPTAPKLYDFLFLNGRLRPHRKYLIDRLRQLGILDRALWTNLQSRVDMGWTSDLPIGSDECIRLLPSKYEIERSQTYLACDHSGKNFVKHELFRDTWGDAIINPRAYVDTCFSVVTETIFDYPYTFRTEKIWKPMIMCHPFVVAANAGYYRDLQQAGFRTFDHLIDESFDLLDNNKDRADRIADVIKDICQSGSASFLQAAQEVCKYNYQHLREHNRRERHLLPKKLEYYIDARS